MYVCVRVAAAATGGSSGGTAAGVQATLQSCIFGLCAHGRAPNRGERSARANVKARPLILQRNQKDTGKQIVEAEIEAFRC